MTINDLHVPAPRLLSSSLTEVRRLHPAVCSVTLNLTGPSEATMTLSDGEEPPAMHDLVELYTVQGSAGIFRVVNIAAGYRESVEITLRHAIDTLADSLWKAQETYTGTMTQYLTRLLSFQSTSINGSAPWQLGTCACASDVTAKAMNYDRLSTLLAAVEEDEVGYCFTYDFSTAPWTLNLVAKPTNVSAEFRLNRNLKGVTVTLDDTELCNRLRVSTNHTNTASDGTKTVDTAYYDYNNTTSQAVWGIVEKVADIDVAEDVKSGVHAETDAWAAKFLAERADPSVQIECTALILEQLTGDAWDSPVIGDLCRVALPDYGKTFSERVVSVTWDDVYGDPLSASVSLSNVLPRFSESLAQVRDTAKKAGRTASRAARNADQASSWTQVVSDTEEAVNGVGINTLWQTGIILDAHSGARIYSLMEGLEALNSEIVVDKNHISLVVSGTGANATVNTASIVLAINGGTGHSSAKIEADQILLEGNTTLKGSLDIVGGELHSTYPISTTSYLKGTSLTISDTNGTASLTSTNIKNTFVSAKVTNSDTLTVKKQDSTTAFTIEKSGSSLVISDGTGTITFSGAAAGWASAAAAVVWPSAGTATSFGVTVPASTENTTTSKTFTLSSSGSYCICSDGTNTVARWSRTGTITAASPTTTQPSSGNNLRTVTVGSGGNKTYVKLSASGYRAASNNDYITISY